VADTGEGRALVLADYHAGLEVALRYDGVEVPSRAGERRERLLGLHDQPVGPRPVE
jgi:metallophosphoesterase superfamily enzyme